MTVLFVLLPVSMLLAVAAVLSFVWSVRRGQLDDLETPALRMLLDDDRIGGSSVSSRPAGVTPPGAST